MYPFTSAHSTPREAGVQDGVVRIALIGAGFIGRIHGLAIQAVNHVFGVSPLRAEASVLVDLDPALAERQARQLGFKAWSSDWEAAIREVDAVVIAVPSFMHREIALAALSLGKHVLCEKPVGRSSEEAVDVARGAAEAGVTNGVGFTYLRAPLVRHAVDIVASGTLGEPVSFRGWHAEDYLADPDAAFSWRLDAGKAGRCGALGDLGWHIISIARALCGPIASLHGLARTAYETRPLQPGGSGRRAVENDDWAAMTATFASGAVGTIEASRIAHGRKMDIGFDLTCTKGSLAFRGERANELEIYRSGGAGAEQGFGRVLINGAHPGYAAFLPAPAHGLGFNDLKTIEMREFLLAIQEGRNLGPDLDEAVRIARICEATLDSSGTGERIDDPEAARGGFGEPREKEMTA
jgi:predicted dehydrogenase